VTVKNTYNNHKCVMISYNPIPCIQMFIVLKILSDFIVLTQSVHLTLGLIVNGRHSQTKKKTGEYRQSDYSASVYTNCLKFKNLTNSYSFCQKIFFDQKY